MTRFLLVPFLLLAMAAPAQAQDDVLRPPVSSNFGRLFPGLPPLDQNTDLDIADLAQSMLDPNADSENNCTVTVPLATEGCVFSIMTYGGGQFFDHDITLDRQPSPVAPVDPTTLTNFRTFKLDLDSVYAGGPTGSPQLYDGDRFLVQEANENGVRDLPRNPDGSAILVETRNDENQVISQFHVAFLKFHNRLIDEGLSFDEAREYLTLHYQAAVVNELAAHTLSPSLGPDPLEANNDVKKLAKDVDFTPVEFSIAAFRYGHSNVRLAYRLNGNNNCQNLQVFSLTAPAASLMGGRPLQAGRQIDWGMFTDELPKPAGCPNNDRNIQRKFDALMSASLFRLPNPFVSDRDNVLGFLNMIRAKHYGIPSGQAVAAELGLPVLTGEELGLSPDLQARFAAGVPLWFYILRESSVRENGQRLGPTGSLIVAAAFRAMLDNDDDSIFRKNKHFVPDPRVAGEDGRMTLPDIVVFAGTAT